MNSLNHHHHHLVAQPDDDDDDITLFTQLGSRFYGQLHNLPSPARSYTNDFHGNAHPHNPRCTPRKIQQGLEIRGGGRVQKKNRPQ
ncbi:hypothetical protein CEXT_446181 [Caerostris extrusa]|uniref:Uncharacterized protein n=1 Tax=Caerostris extrusa TaxID=172846 RepID=A0AAV4YBW4_CAEEX|nr:hypothetical protein CEXT_446181 [Caerostris extrusa]